QKDAGDGRMARRGRMQRGKAFDLVPDVGRGVEQKPEAAVRADGQRILRARAQLRVAGADPLAIRTAAIPLRKPAAGRGAQDAQSHVWLLYHRSGRPTATPQGERPAAMCLTML